MRLEGKTAIITGSGRGIGRGVALRLASEGARIMLADINQEDLENTAYEIKNMGVETAWCLTDVRKMSDVQKLMDSTMDRFGQIDILVNNAGISISGNVVDFREEDWDKLIDINLKGVFRCSQAAAREMMKKQSGCIISLSSESGKTGYPLFAIYAASKFGVIGFTQGFAREMAPYNIRVNAVCPGIIDTKMWEEIDETLCEMEHVKKGTVKERKRESIPLGRLGTPADIAGVIAFLVSEDASYMTAQSINITGGLEVH